MNIGTDGCKPSAAGGNGMESENPYASPESNSARPKSEAIPRALVVCPSVIASCYAAVGIANLAAGTLTLGPFTLAGVSVAFPVVFWFRRYRFIWRLSRWFAGFLAVTHALFALVMVWRLVEIAILTNFFTRQIPYFETPGTAIFVLVAAMAVISVASWMWLSALNSARTRRLINLQCPQCDSMRAKPFGFTLQRAKCRECGETW